MANRSFARATANITRDIGDLLQKSADKRLSSIIPTQVDLAGDLSVAKVRYVIADPTLKRSEMQLVLDKCSGYLRSELAKKGMRKTPRIWFEFDNYVEKEREDQKLFDALKDTTPESDDQDTR